MRTARSGGLATLALIAVLGTASCATTAAQTRRVAPEDPSQLRSQVFKLQKDSARILEMLTELRDAQANEDGELEPAAVACAEATTRLGDLEMRLTALEDQILATQQRIDSALVEIRSLRRASTSFARDLTPPPSMAGPPSPDAGGDGTAGIPADESAEETTDQADAGSPESVDPSSTGSPQDYFNAAYADYSREDYESALVGFETALRIDPDGPMAPTSLFYVGEVLLAMERYSDAISAYENFITTYPDSDRVLAARYRRGMALFESMRRVEGVQELQSIIEDAPDSHEARLAEEYLRRRGIAQD